MRPIDADRLLFHSCNDMKGKCRYWGSGNCYTCQKALITKADIDNAPTVERPQGEWVNEHCIDIGYKTAVCSCCGERSRLIAHDTGFGNEYEGYPFFPWCGADMKGCEGNG